MYFEFEVGRDFTLSSSHMVEVIYNNKKKIKYVFGPLISSEIWN